jgi:MarR family transcriptional regulator, organic hydroperoxide resistance regulator
MTDDLSLGLSISRIRRSFRRAFEKRAEVYGITATQIRLLWRLWDQDGLPISELAEAGEVDGGTITGVLDRLEAKGYTRRERCHEDRRNVRIWLTPLGREVQGPLTGILADLNRQALVGLPPPDQKHLLEMLDRVDSNLGDE